MMQLIVWLYMHVYTSTYTQWHCVGIHCLLSHSLLNLLRWSLSLNPDFTYLASQGSQLGWEILCLCFLSAGILSALPRMPDLIWSQGFSHAQMPWLAHVLPTHFSWAESCKSQGLAPIGARTAAEPKLSAASPAATSDPEHSSRSVSPYET